MKQKLKLLKASDEKRGFSVLKMINTSLKEKGTKSPIKKRSQHFKNEKYTPKSKKAQPPPGKEASVFSLLTIEAKCQPPRNVRH
jgi:hypothetical protein